LRQTFGEQFLAYVIAFKFSNEIVCLSDELATIQTHKTFASSEWRDHVSSHSRDVCV